jgi:tricorn protease-like protein
MRQELRFKFARYAHVANDGTIAFTYQDDIWVADPNGANPRRLTAHVARDFMPRFSPDGRGSPSLATAWATTTSMSCRSPAASRSN